MSSLSNQDTMTSVSSINSFFSRDHIPEKKDIVIDIETISFERFIAKKPLSDDDDARLQRYHIIKKSPVIFSWKHICLGSSCSYIFLILTIVLLASAFFFEIRNPSNLIFLFGGIIGCAILFKYIGEARNEEIARIIRNRELIGKNLSAEYLELIKKFIKRFIVYIQLPSELLGRGYSIEEIHSVGYGFHNREEIEKNRQETIEKIEKIKNAIQENENYLFKRRIPEHERKSFSKLMNDFVDFFLNKKVNISDNNKFDDFYIQTKHRYELDCINRIEKLRLEFKAQPSRENIIPPRPLYINTENEFNEENLGLIGARDTKQVLRTPDDEVKESKANLIRSISSNEGVNSLIDGSTVSLPGGLVDADSSIKPIPQDVNRLHQHISFSVPDQSRSNYIIT